MEGTAKSSGERDAGPPTTRAVVTKSIGIRGGAPKLSRALPGIALCAAVSVWASPAPAAISAGPLVRITGPSPIASCSIIPSIPNEVSFTGDEVEPFLAVDPKSVHTSHVNLIAAWQQDRLSQDYALGLGAASSTNGGRTWSRTLLPFSACVDSGSPFDHVTDPWVSVGKDGIVYAAGVAEGKRNGQAFAQGVVVSTSPDGGKTWTAPRVVGGLRSADKDSITADPYRPRTAYAIWNGSGGAGTEGTGYIEWMSRTTDGGETWSSPSPVVNGSDGSQSQGNEIVVAPGGTLYSVFGWWTPHLAPLTRCSHLHGHRTCKTYRYDPQDPIYDMYIAFSVSHNHGATWSLPNPIASNRSAGSPDGSWIEPRNARDWPSTAMGSRPGTFYVAWQDARFNGNAYDGIVLAVTHDDGKHWSKPIPVTRPGSARAFNPAIAVNSKGVIGVTYYTVSRWSAKDATWPASYWFVSSRDGIHFSKPLRLAGPFNIKAVPQGFVGDYEGLVAAGKTFHALFSMGNHNDPSNPSDVFTTSITPG